MVSSSTLTSSETPSGPISGLPETISPPFNETNSSRAVAQYATTQRSSAGSAYNFYRYHPWAPLIALGVALGLF